MRKLIFIMKCIRLFRKKVERKEIQQKKLKIGAIFEVHEII